MHGADRSAAAFDAVERVADAVLFEGYVLYPYRASAAKNQMRWQFGVVAPRSASDSGEPWFSQTECLVEPRADAPRLDVRVRCLRPQSASGAAPAWLDGVPHAVDICRLALDPARANGRFTLSALGLDVQLQVGVERADRFLKLQIKLENLEPWRAEFDRSRDAMLARSLVGTHLLLGLDGGSFVSLLEPPSDAEALAADCDNRHTWPVLVGDRVQRNLMLSSPIVLYDFPAVAPESPGDLCDAAEIDEILSLRILTMTDDEKREARATDPRARRILDRVEAMTPETLATLHGVMRSADFFNPPGEDPDQAAVTVAGARFVRGSHVRLRPNRRADAMDMFLAGQAATVAGVHRDVDNRVYVAVTVDADPAASMHDSFGRYFYFDPTELEPVDREEEHV